MSLIRTTDAATEPVTLAEAKLWARLTSDTTDDAVVTALIVSARMTAEQEMRRAIISQTWDITQATFPGCEGFTLHWPRVTAVTHVKYYDTSNVQQTLASTYYATDFTQEPGKILLAYNQSWPDVYDRPDAVTVRYVTGWASASVVPESIKTWIKAMVCHYYENREAATLTLSGQTMTALPFLSGLLDPHRIWVL